MTRSLLGTGVLLMLAFWLWTRVPDRAEGMLHQQASSPGSQQSVELAAGEGPLPAQGQQRARLEGQEEATASLLVEVRGSRGAIPLRRVGVLLAALRQVRAAATDRRALTDAAGNCLFLGLLPGWVEVRATLGGGRQRVELLPGQRAVLRLTLPAGSTVQGQVVDPTGRPVPGAAVHVSDLIHGMFAEPAVRCDAQGRFRIGSVRVSNRIHARAEGFGPSEVHGLQQAIATARPLLLQLSGLGGRVIGRVLDPHGRPVARAWVFLGEDPRGTQTPLRGAESGAPVGLFLWTDEDGSFRSKVMPPGTHSLVARAEGWASAATRVELVAGAETQAELRLRAGFDLRGRVLDARGQALAGVRIACGWAGNFALRREVRSDAEGAYRLPGLEPGLVALRASLSPQQRQTFTVKGASGAEVVRDLRFEARHDLIGQVLTQSGAPLAGVEVVASDPHGGVQRGRTLANGSFTLRSCGRHLQVRAQRENFLLGQVRGVDPAAGPVVIRVAADADACIRGRLVDGQGHPVAGSVLAVPSRPAVFPMFAVDPRTGRFACTPIPGGQYRLKFLGQGSLLLPARTEDLRVEGGQVLELGDLVLRRGCRVILRLEPAIATAQLSLEPKAGGRRRGIRVGAQGKGRPAVLLPGRYRLRLQAEGYQAVDRILTVPDQAELRETLRLQPGSGRD